jgi:hypothetical protein
LYSDFTFAASTHALVRSAARTKRAVSLPMSAMHFAAASTGCPRRALTLWIWPSGALSRRAQSIRGPASTCDGAGMAGIVVLALAGLRLQKYLRSSTASQSRCPQPVQEPVTLYLELTGNTAAFRTVDLVARVQGYLARCRPPQRLNWSIAWLYRSRTRISAKPPICLDITLRPRAQKFSIVLGARLSAWLCPLYHTGSFISPLG